MLKRVGIPSPEKRVHEYPYQLSGGMRQRVMISMALSCHPKILIADEPTTALDVTIQAQILDLMNQLKEETGTAILLITHNLGVVAEMADKVVVMYSGKVMESAEVDAIFYRACHPYTRGLLETLPRIDDEIRPGKKLPEIPGMVPNLSDLPAGCAFHPRCRYAMDVPPERRALELGQFAERTLLPVLVGDRGRGDTFARETPLLPARGFKKALLPEEGALFEIRCRCACGGRDRSRRPPGKDPGPGRGERMRKDHCLQDSDPGHRTHCGGGDL